MEAAEPPEAAAGPEPAELPRDQPVTTEFARFPEGLAASPTPLPTFDDDLFAETGDEEFVHPATEVLPEEPVPAPLPAPPPEPLTPAIDKSHWRSLLGELGIEAPPEPELEQAPRAEDIPTAKGAEMTPDRFHAAEREAPNTQVPERRSRREKKPAATVTQTSQPFGGGLFSEDEEQRFVRSVPEPTSEETPASLRESEVPAPESDSSVSAEEPAQRKRGRRRTRAWSRLHSHAEEAQESQGAEPVENLEVAELVEEVETADDLFGDVEQPAAPAEEDEEGERRRPRRRRRRRGERTSQESAPRAERSRDDEDEVAPSEELFGEEADEEMEEAPRPRPERRRRRSPVESATEASDEEDEGDSELDADLEGERPAHRKIPTWDEAVGLVISINMEARAKSGGGRRRR